MRFGLCVFLAVAAVFAFSAGAGEIIKKTYYDSKGRAVGKYVYQAGDSRRDYARASRVRYPVHRPGYVYSGLVYSPSLYRVSRPITVSRGIYHVGWRGYCGYHWVPRYFIAPQRVYYRR